MRRLLFLATAGLVLSAVLAGFWVVGGPSEGRAERFDWERVKAMNRLQRELGCNKGRDPQPETLIAAIACSRRSELEIRDPETGEVYDFRMASDGLHICTAFSSRLYRRGGMTRLDYDRVSNRACVHVAY